MFLNLTNIEATKHQKRVLQYFKTSFETPPPYLKINIPIFSQCNFLVILKNKVASVPNFHNFVKTFALILLMTKIYYLGQHTSSLL